MTTGGRIATALPTVAEPWADDRQWSEKLVGDRLRADANQTSTQREITGEIVRRAAEAGAAAVALTGSTARNRRSESSDLDYHVVGRRFKTNDLPGEVDVYFGNSDRFWSKLREGDDFVQWTLRFGCILSDDGIFRAGLRAISVELIWPIAEAKLARLPDMQRLAQRLLEMDDRDAAQDQLRATLTTLARALLLAARVFPLARVELPEQLRRVGHEPVADALAETIHSQPSLSTLHAMLGTLTTAGGVEGGLERSPPPT
ncbi:MAG: hypothetical protein QOE44_3148 [Solirubrobacteraceae bacterium]|jgi:hypothetical protein|nr:hypothetical protein [Solirubrobacteraceae bacterium]